MLSAHWTGPLPPPAALEAFERAHPGSAERIIIMAEREQAAQIAMTQTELDDERAATARGQWLGFALPSLFGIASVVSVFIGADPWVSGVLGAVPAVGIITAIVQGRPKPAK